MARSRDDDDKIVTHLIIREKEYPVRLRLYGKGANASSTFILEGVTAGRYNQEVTADTLGDLYKRGMAASKAKTARIALAIQALDTRTVNTDERGYGGKRQFYMRNGTIVGKHTGNGNLLIQWEGRTDVEQYTASGYGSREELYRPMSEDDAKRFAEINEQQNNLVDEERRISERYKYGDVRQAVEIAIERKMSEESTDD